jgi:hypothetical protein
MKPLTILVLCVGVFVLLPLALYLGDWLFSGQQTPLVRRLTLADLLREARRQEQLESDRATLIPIVAERERIINELIEGRCSLPDAADALREACERKPSHLRESYLRASEQSSEEFFVRLAFIRAESAVTDHPRREAILARLRGELQDYLYAQAAAQP